MPINRSPNHTSNSGMGWESVSGDGYSELMRTEKAETPALGPRPCD